MKELQRSYPYYRTKKPLPVRDLNPPKRKSKASTEMPKGQMFKVIEIGDGWYEVVWNHYGYRHGILNFGYEEDVIEEWT